MQTYNSKGDIYLSFGDPPPNPSSPPGMVWQYQATAPAISGGSFSLLQLVEIGTTIEANASPTPTPPFPEVGPPDTENTNGAYLLDGCQIYADAIHASSGSSSAFSANIGYDDSPGVPLAHASPPANLYYTYAEVDAKYAFQDYFIFLPDRPPGEPAAGPPSLWITIGYQIWNFGATSWITSNDTWLTPPTWIYGSTPSGSQTNAFNNPVTYASALPAPTTCPTLPTP